MRSVIKSGDGYNFEIIIADGMSDDKTREIIKEFQKDYSNIFLLDNFDQIIPTGFNIALNESKGDIIIRLDGHSYIDPDFIKNILYVFHSIDADCVGGYIENVSSGCVGNAIKYAQSSKFGVGGVDFRTLPKKGKYVDTLAFGAYDKNIFKIGGYDEEFIKNEDDEFHLRLLQNGGKIWLDPSIKSYYHSRSSLLKLFTQYYYYGFYKIRVIQKRRGIASIRHIVPAIFVLSIFGSIYVYLMKINVIFLPMILSSYLITNLFSTLFEAVKLFKKSAELKPKIRLIPSIIIIPLVYLILHFSYGLGFIIGTFYFFKKWNDLEPQNKYFKKNIAKN